MSTRWRSTGAATARTSSSDGTVRPSLDDVRAVAAPVLRHRVLMTFQAEADGITPDQVVTELLRG